MVAIDSIAIAIVSYTVTISMALIFAKKQNYEVRPNQELLAMGLSNIVGGMFSCVPNATSLSRSLIQEQTGGRTQIASVVSAFLILIILLWIAPFFQVLPRVIKTTTLFNIDVFIFIYHQIVTKINAFWFSIAVRIIRHYNSGFERNVHTGR